MNTATGFQNIDIQNKDLDDKTIALIGNSFAGKQAVKNAFMNLDRNAKLNDWGNFIYDKEHYHVVDLPNIHSLTEHSAEEKTAHDFLRFGGADVVMVVCEAVYLERSLNLALQIIEMTSGAIVCLNDVEGARKKHIQIDISRLERALGVPVAVIKEKDKNISLLIKQIHSAVKRNQKVKPTIIRYIRPIEKAVSILEPSVKGLVGNQMNSRWVSLKLLEDGEVFTEELNSYIDEVILTGAELFQKIAEAQKYLADCGIWGDIVHDNMVSCRALTAEGICNDCVCYQ